MDMVTVIRNIRDNNGDDNGPDYTIVGQVVDRVSRRGVRGARIEAWDRDTKFHDLLGQAITDDDGRFTLRYDSLYFGDFQPDTAPDLFFRVRLDDQLVLDTIDRPRMNTPPGRLVVTLEIDLPQARPLGKDLVSPEQAIKIVDWWRASDFKGVLRESKGKSGTVLRSLSGNLGERVAHWDFAPVRPPATTENSIVGQTTVQAQSALFAQGVQVSEVRAVEANTIDQLRALSRYPLALEAGERVVLYQQDGIVQYYARAPVLQTAEVDAQAVAELDAQVQVLKGASLATDALRGELAELQRARSADAQRASDDAAARAAQAEQMQALQAELLVMRQRSAEKDAEIVRLRGDLGTLREAQDQLAERVSLRRLEALETRLNLLAPAGRTGADGEGRP
jgi:hypothetical protein